MHAWGVALIVACAIWFTAVISIVYLMLKAPPLPCEICGLPASRETAHRRDLCETCFRKFLRTPVAEDDARQTNLTADVEMPFVDTEEALHSSKNSLCGTHAANGRTH
jgi:hypothetical protein